MPSIAELFAIIRAALEFPGAVLEFVHLLEKTPIEQHEALLKAIELEAKKFEETGRPTWG